MANNTLTQLNQLQIAFKKLLGKSHTNPNKEFFNENYPSAIQSTTDIIFGESIPSITVTPANYTNTSNITEVVPFTLQAITTDSTYDADPGNATLSSYGTTIGAQTADTAAENTSTVHAYKLVLPSNYQSNSTNPKVGTGPFINSKVVADTTGSLQIIPESFGLGYRAVVKDSSGNSISNLGNENWIIDPYIGILWIQDQGGSFAVPASVTASLYIGKYASEVIESGSGGSAGNGFPFSGSAVITGSLTISGSSGPELIVSGTIIVTEGITGSLFGTASWANNATSASYAATASKVSVIDDESTNSNYAIVFADPAVGSDVQLKSDATYFTYNPSNASILLGAVGGGTFAINSSSLVTVNAPQFTLLNETNQTVDFGATGGIGVLNINHPTVNIKGAITASIISASSGITGSLFGTASWAVSASRAISSSYALSASYTLSSSYAFSASYALSSSYALNATSASYSLSSSYALNATSASYALSSSYALNATSASYSLTASYVNPLTQSVYISGGIEIIGANNSTVYTGIHRIGLGIQTATSITGSGLIISSSNLPTNNYNFLKIGDVELVDNTYLGTSNEFLINNVDYFAVTSGSNPSAAPSKLFTHNGDEFEIFVGGETTSRLKVNANATTVLSQDLAIRADIATSLIGGVLVLESVPLSNTAASVARVPETYFIFSTGSNQIISGGLTITGSLNVTQGITGSLFGTASWAQSASQAISASYVLSASYALTSSYASYAVTSSVSDAILISPTNNSNAYKVAFTFDTSTADYRRLNIDNGSGEFTYNPFTNVLSVGTITASAGLYGTSSWAENTTSASYAASASTIEVITKLDDTQSFGIAFYDLYTASFDTNGEITSGVRLQGSKGLSYSPELATLILQTDYSNTGSVTISRSGITVYNLDSNNEFEIQNISGSILLHPGSNLYGVVSEVMVSGSLTVTDGITGSLYGTASWANNTITASHALTASSVNTLNQNVTINGNLTAGTSSLANLTVTNNAIINGDLFVYGSASVINVNNLSIEDKFILLNSGSTGPIANEGGIIVQTSASDGTAYGTALFYDQEANRWLVAKSSSVAFNTTSITVGATTDFIVTVSASAGSPVGTPPNFGTGNSDYSVGQMYIQTNTSDIYIYA